MFLKVVKTKEEVSMTRRELRVKVIFNLYENDLLDKVLVDEESEVGEIALDILEKLKEIDAIIEDNLYNYSLYRLAYLDKAIIRYATYEMLYTDTPKEIVINEAIEITKEYSDIDDKQKAFTNSVLDSIKKSIGD